MWQVLIQLFKNVKCVMWQVLIQLFKICGYFVGVHDNDDDEQQTKKANHTDKSLICNQKSQCLG